MKCMEYKGKKKSIQPKTQAKWPQKHNFHLVYKFHQTLLVLYKFIFKCLYKAQEYYWMYINKFANLNILTM